jgi:sarcosine oxidase subunit gamma
VLLSDLSREPRAGLKGSAATERLRELGAVIPALNAAELQTDGSLLLRLGANEYVALRATGLFERLTAFAMGSDNAPGLCPVPRFAGNAWFSLEGEPLDELFAKLCSVDLRARHFADRRVAQTIVARTSAVLVREDLEGRTRFHVLVDTATAPYLWDVLRDAMTEYGGSTAS